MNPKLRFKLSESQSAWAPCRIGDILSVFHGKDYKGIPEGDIPVLATSGQIASVSRSLCTWPCALIGRKGTINKPQFMDSPFWSVDTLFYTKPKGNHHPKFQYYLFQTIDWMKYNEGSGVPSLSAHTIQKIKVLTPSAQEQEKIASFLSQLDSKINLAERTLGLIENTRKATTDQIFKHQLCLTKTDGSLYEHWQEHTFSSIFTFLRTKPIPRAHLNGHNSPYNIHYGDILTKYDTTIDLQTDELPSISDDINMSNTDVLKEGDLIIADTAEDSSAGKAIEILNTSNQTIYAGLHTFACRPNTKFAPGFLGYYLNSSSYHNQLLRLMTGTKVLSISKAQISTTKILIPTLAEQERITTLLNNLREKTRIQRKKLCALKALKNALLQQMFV